MPAQSTATSRPARAPLAPSAPAHGGALVAALALLAVANVASNRLVPSAWYVPWNLAVAAALVVVAVRGAGLGRAALGLGPGWARRGLRWGAEAWGLVLALYAVALALPATRDLFRDQRAAAPGVGAVAYQALVRIPLGTVVLEEVAFRGVLPALARLRWRPGVAVAWSALAFGCWHVLPAWGIEHTNPVLESGLVGGAGRSLAVAGAVAATTAAGFALAWVRARSTSLLAPAMVHLATNSFGFTLAWALQRSG